MPVRSATLLYFSPTGTTRTIVTAIASGIPLPNTHIDVTVLSHRSNSYHIPSDSLLIAGVPVYGGRVPEVCTQFLTTLSVRGHYVVPVVVYGNRAYEDALLELADIFVAKECIISSAGAFVGEHSFTSKLGRKRPDEADRHVAQQFGKHILQHIRAGRVLPITAIPGQRPYRERNGKFPASPVTSSACTQCLTCVEHCPMQAISSTDPTTVDVNSCIYCASCVKRCPEQAKYIAFAPLISRMEQIIAAHKEPKMPDIFLPDIVID